MRIHSITAHAFGPFVNQTIEFGPGMNLIYGPNEAGKSSWHAALFAGLCGIRRGRGPNEKGDVAFRERHQPWLASEWRVAIILSLEDGRRIEMDYDLDGKVARVIDADLGRDYANEIIYDGAPDASRWLGLDRKAFLSTACVKQADLFAIREGRELLQEHIQRAADTAGVDETAAGALELLNTFRRERIGTAAVNARGPLRQAMNRVQEAEAELRGAKERHDAYELLAARAEHAKSAADAAERRLHAMEARIALDDAEDWNRRLSRAAELHARHPEGEPQSVTGDEELAQQVAAAVATWSERSEIPALSGSSAKELSDEIDALPAPPVGDTAVHGTVRAAANHYHEVAGARERHRTNRPRDPETVSAGGLREQELRDLARDLEAVDPAVDVVAQEKLQQAQRELDALPPGRGSMPRVVAGGVLVAAGLLAIAVDLLLPGLALVLIGAAVAIVSWPTGNEAARLQKVLAIREAEEVLGAQRHALDEVRRRRSEARDQAESLGLEPTPAALRALADHLAASVLAQQRFDEWEAGQEGLAAELTQAQAQLEEALRARGVDTAVGVEAAVAAYEADCQKRSAQAAAAARRQDLQGQLEARKRLEEAASEAEQKAAAAAARLRMAAMACGVEMADEASMLTGLKAWQSEREGRLRALTAARDEWSQLQTLLGGGTLEELEREAARRTQLATERMQGVAEDELGKVELTEDAETRLDALRRETANAARERDERHGQLSTLAETAMGVPEAEEGLAAAKEELQRVRELAAIVDLTRDFLRAAQDRVHRDIAPVLAGPLKQWLPTVTGGRYQEVLVDPETLQVQVRPTGGIWRDASLLSHGTAEQVYLLLRVALARHLTRKGEVCPLLLDDVTVQSDPRRTIAILQILHQLSDERQIILFSQEPEVLQWAKANLADKRERVIELAEPGVPA